MAVQHTRGNGGLSASELQLMLMERAERLHEYIEWKIPESLQGQMSADDVIQEVWIAAFRGLPDFRADNSGAFDRWLTRIADRKLLDAIRMSRRVKRGGRHCIERGAQRKRTSCLELFARISCGQRTPSSEEAAREAVHAVRIALGALPDKYRQAITLCHLDGQTRADIARTMRTSPSAVHGLLYRAMVKLRRLLGPPTKFFSDDRATDRSPDEHTAVGM